LLKFPKIWYSNITNIKSKEYEMMKRFSVLLLGIFLICSQSLPAFDFSPTQTPGKIVRARPAQPAPELVEKILSNEVLAKGLDCMVTSVSGNAPDSLRGELSEPLKGDLTEATKKYLISHADLFNIPINKNKNVLKLLKQVEAAGAHHFYYQMDLNGVPVHEAVIDLHVGKDKRIQLANGAFPTVREITNQISIGRIEAIAAAKRSVGIKKVRGVPKAELVVYPSNEKGIMAYRVKISSNDPLGDFDVLIDAETGKEISRLNQLVFIDTHSGKGSVFVNHPLVSSATVEDLLHLTTHGLKGLYADVANEDAEASVNEKDEHIYDPDNTHFDESMIYFQINRIHDFFKSLGHDKMDKPMRATVHVGDNYDNAYYSPWEDAMSFGDGSKFNDLAKEEAVCWHEYSHAALNPIVSLNYSKESGAMNEGQADYFACSLSDDPKLGEYVCAKMNKPYLRILTNSLHYPEDIQGEVHADGKIWGGVLWDLRTALGPKVSDLLIHKSFYYLKPGSPKFIDGMNAILTADKNLFEGKNSDKIREVFKKRGISTQTSEGAIVDGTDIKRMKLFRNVHEK